MEKAPAELVERFNEVIGRFPEVERRQMFGYPCGFVGGQMATGLHESTWIVRLPEADRADVLGLEGSRQFEPMSGRPMREYVVLPQAILDDTDALVPWLERSIAYVASLPPKPPKARKAAGAARGATASR